MRQPSQGVKKGATPTKRSVQNAFRWDNGSIETVAHKTKLPALLLSQGQDQHQDSEVKALIMHPKCSQGHKCLQCESSANVSRTAENTRTLTHTHTQTNSDTHLASSRGLVVKSEWTICTGVEAKVIRDSLKKNYTTFCGAITRCKNAQGRGLIVRLGSSCEMLETHDKCNGQYRAAVSSSVALFGPASS